MRSLFFHFLLIFTLVLLSIFLTCCAPADSVRGGGEPAPPDALYIDTHAHLDDVKIAGAAISEMNRYNIGKMLLMPTPAAMDRYNTSDLEAAAAATRRHPQRFAFLGGGGTLNAMIHQNAGNLNPGEKLVSRFEKRAADIIGMGAVGFGEMAALHLSLKSNHPYIEAPPDHPLFLKLADLAAYYGVPIDLHMEAVAVETRLDGELAQPPNPPVQTPDIEAFERLLRHNPKAIIIWSHIGWDNTGQRTVELTRTLLQRHPNLYMNFKLRRDGVPESKPLAGGRTIRPEWLTLIREFPDRFTIGSDSKFIRVAEREGRKDDIKGVMALLAALPEDLARKVGYENARNIFRLD